MLEHCRRHHRSRPFAVGTSNMKHTKYAMRIADPLQQEPHGLQAQLDTMLLKSVEVVDNGGVAHQQAGGMQKAKNDSRGCRSSPSDACARRSYRSSRAREETQTVGTDPAIAV